MSFKVNKNSRLNIMAMLRIHTVRKSPVFRQGFNPPFSTGKSGQIHIRKTLSD
jgi:predicted transposase YdaD